MPHMLMRGRRVLLASLLAAVVVPAGAQAKIIELGQTAQDPVPTCPAKPCLAVSRTTGYQAKVRGTRGLFAAPHLGKVVAWSITLGNPNKKQIAFFNSTLGGAPRAGIVVLRASRHKYGRIMAQSPVKGLTAYLGETVQFPLDNALHVHKGDMVALTVPTWAPALAVGFGSSTSWRASRPSNRCDDTSTQTSVSGVGTTTQFRCLYRTARLTYTVTMITSPHGPLKKKSG